MRSYCENFSETPHDGRRKNTFVKIFSGKYGIKRCVNRAKSSPGCPYYKKISGTNKNITVSYKSSWDELNDVSSIIEHLKETHERDIRLLTTTSGIHRDRFTVNDENGPLVVTGSTGQIRLASLLFRIAEARIFKEKTGKDPILLLDDVLLELDDIKRARFLEELTSYSQAFYTFLPRESYFNEIKDDLLDYNVVEGKLYEV